MIMFDRKSCIGGKKNKKKQLSRSLLEFLLELALQFYHHPTILFNL
jgi:hypothetical protein